MTDVLTNSDLNVSELVGGWGGAPGEERHRSDHAPPTRIEVWEAEVFLKHLKSYRDTFFT